MLLVVAQPVDAMIEAVEGAAFRLKTVADRIAKTGGEDAPVGAVRVHDGDRRILLIGLGAGIAGRSDRDIELAVRAELDHAVRMLTAFGKAVGNQFQFAQRAVFGPRRAIDVVDGHQIDRVAVDLDAVHILLFGDSLALVGLAVAIRVAQHQDIALVAAGDIERAVFGDFHHSGILDITREDVDRKALRQSEAVHALLAPIERDRLFHMADDLDALAAAILLCGRFAGAGARLGKGGMGHGERRGGQNESASHGSSPIGLKQDRHERGPPS